MTTPPPTHELRLLIAGGGTGGHLLPGIAVLEALEARGVRVDARFLVTQRRFDGEFLGKRGLIWQTQPVRPMTSRPWRWPGILQAWRESLHLAEKAILHHESEVVLGLGGFGSGPAGKTAAGLGVPLAVLNPDVLPGRANRFLQSRAERIFLQWERTAEHFKANAPTVVTGTPLRKAALRGDRRAGIEFFDLDPNKKTLLITGASQGAMTINQAALALLEPLSEFAETWQLLHLTGGLSFRKMQQTYRRTQSGVTCRVVEFVEEMALAWSVADLIVSRAGAGMVAEIAAAGLPAVFLPYPFHRDQHQRLNAKVLEEADAAVICKDKIAPRKNLECLWPVLADLMSDESRRNELGQNARKLGRPDAADTVAKHLLEIAGKS